MLDKCRIREEMGYSGTRKELCVYISERHREAVLEYLCSCGGFSHDSSVGEGGGSL